MKSGLKLYRKLRQFLWRLRCYTSIETLPVVIWFKIHETGDASLLYRHFKFGFINLTKVWEQIYNEYIKVIGLNAEYLEYIESIKAIGELQCQCIEDPSPVNKADLRIMLSEMKEKQSRKQSHYSEIIAQVSKAQGYPVWKVSVLEFYSYIKINGK